LDCIFSLDFVKPLRHKYTYALAGDVSLPVGSYFKVSQIRKIKPKQIEKEPKKNTKKTKTKQ
jgi:hypothetical protein